jgi:hypothetical protein
MVAGNAQAAIYAEPGSTRTTRLPWSAARASGAFGVSGDVVTALLAEPGVALVMGEEAPGDVRVASSDGEAAIRRDGDRISYTLLSGDPLAIGQARTLDATEWLAATMGGPFPDGPVVLLDQFRSPRTGDLILAAAEGWDFREAWEHPEHKSGHGSLIAGHMLTPLWSNRPLGEHPWRTVDVFPRLCEWLGVAVPSGIDGR